MENTDPRLVDIQLGIEIEAFLHSAVGKHLAGRAAEEREMALSLLADVHPEDSSRIRELQNQHWRASSIVAWLVEAMQVSAHAEAELTAE